MSTRGWTQADVDAYRARQSANAPKNAPSASGASTLAPMAGQPQTPARAKPCGSRGPNKTEARFNRDMLAGRGVYEGLTFRLPGGSRYTPDWIYVDGAGVVHAFEVKGPHRFPSEGRALTAFLEARAAWRSVVFAWFRWTGSEWREQHCEAVASGGIEAEKKLKKGVDKPNRLVYITPHQSHHRGGEGKTEEPNMTTNEAIKTILNHHAVEEVTLATKGKFLPSTYRIELKEGHKFGDGTQNWLVAEGKLKKIATLIAI